MEVYQIIFLAMMVFGFGLFIIRISFGELGDLFGGEVETIDDGPSWFSLSLISVALISFGGAGLALSHYGIVGFPGLIIQVAATALAYVGVRKYIVAPMMRQQGNAAVTPQSYVGRTGTVTLAIQQGHWGQVQFTDVNGATVRLRAVSDVDTVLNTGQPVKIISVNGDQALVATINEQ